MDKNKKTKKNIFIVSGITVFCIALLAGTYLSQRTPDENFEPASSEINLSTNTWDENTNVPTKEQIGDNMENTQVQGDASDQTHTIVKEDESGSKAKLSNNKTKEETASNKPKEKPVTKDDTENHDKQPEYDSSTSDSKTPASQTDKNTDSNKTDDKNTPSNNKTDDKNNSENSGKVYDPVFGWIDTGTTKQDNVDSDGDINKQVGTMGEN